MAQPSKTATDIITDFELQVADVTELSTVEELRILNRVYQKVCNKRPWTFLRKNVIGTMLTDTTGYYIPFPADFNYIIANNSSTENTSVTYNNAVPAVIYIGTNYSPIQVINYADRRQYYPQTTAAGSTAYCYIDQAAQKIRFIGTPVYTTYDYDYIAVPALLAATDVPIFPGQFHDIIVFGMAIDDFVLQLSTDAAQSQVKNKVFYDEYMADLTYWNAQFYLN